LLHLAARFVLLGLSLLRSSCLLLPSLLLHLAARLVLLGLLLLRSSRLLLSPLLFHLAARFVLLSLWLHPGRLLLSPLLLHLAARFIGLLLPTRLSLLRLPRSRLLSGCSIFALQLFDLTARRRVTLRCSR
jgi:hypothetical protein